MVRASNQWRRYRYPVAVDKVIYLHMEMCDYTPVTFVGLNVRHQVRCVIQGTVSFPLSELRRLGNTLAMYSPRCALCVYY